MAADRDDIGARLRSRKSRAPSGVTTRMSISQPPLRYGRIVTLIAGYSSGDGARFWSSQFSKSSAHEKDSPADADHAGQLAPFDHRVDPSARGAQQIRGLVYREQEEQRAFHDATSGCDFRLSPEYSATSAPLNHGFMEPPDIRTRRRVHAEELF